MKRILLCCICLLTINLNCLGQRKIVWGAQAKLGTSTYEPVELGNSRESLLTYGAGIYADLAFSAHLSFRPQLGWLRKGFQQNTNLYSTGGQLIKVINTKLSYDYLPLDVTFVYRLRPDKVLKPFLQIGARGSVLIDNRVNLTSTTQPVGGTLDLDNFKRVTVGGLLGIGVEWKRFSLGLEANRDLSSYLNPPPISLFEDLKPKFRWYGISLSFQLQNP
ncbi:outer membrane beta-barrel protein [Spirosoma linguale]